MQANNTYQTEFRSQESEWAKRPATANRMNFVLANLFSGFYLIISKQVRTGDYIKLDAGQEGYITDITWRNTTIK